MNKFILLSVLFFISLDYYGQVGINTTDPKGVFNVNTSLVESQKDQEKSNVVVSVDSDTETSKLDIGGLASNGSSSQLKLNSNN